MLQSHCNKISRVLAQKQIKQVQQDPDRNPRCYTHLTFDKDAKTYNGEKAIISINVAGKTGYLNVENWISECRKLKLHPCISPGTSINSK
jgi:hypothetical protein